MDEGNSAATPTPEETPPQTTGHWQDPHLKFLEEPHVYLWDDKPIRVSATGIIDRYFDKFNGMKTVEKWYDGWKVNKNGKYGALIRYLLQVEGKTDQYAKEAICALWDSDGNEASGLGTKMHKQIERTCLGYDVPQSETMPELIQFRKWFPEFLRVGGWQIYAPEKLLVKLDPETGTPVWAGCADCILRSTDDPNKYAILDWKRVDPKGTTVILGQQAVYPNSDGFGREPFDGIPNNKTGKYEVQLNIYAHTLFTDYGIDARDHLYMVQIHHSLPHPNVYHADRLDVPMMIMTAMETADAVREATQSPTF